MRSFLRWLHMAERTTLDLSAIVIAPSIYAHEGIPCAIGAEDVKRVLAVTQDDQTAKGLRDYAILTLLSTYGVRAGEITALRLGSGAIPPFCRMHPLRGTNTSIARQP